MTYPQECVNNLCKNVFYVKKHELSLPLQCLICVKNKENERKSNF